MKIVAPEIEAYLEELARVDDEPVLLESAKRLTDRRRAHRQPLGQSDIAEHDVADMERQPIAERRLAARRPLPVRLGHPVRRLERRRQRQLAGLARVLLVASAREDGEEAVDDEAQDLTAGVKYNALTASLGGGTLNTFAVGAFATPLSRSRAGESRSCTDPAARAGRLGSRLTG